MSKNLFTTFAGNLHILFIYNIDDGTKRYDERNAASRTRRDV